MSKDATDTRDVPAAERGYIVQRVLVDGLTPAQAGAPFGIDERQVDCWVAAYRRYGMASLRGEVAVEQAPRWIGWLRAIAARIGWRESSAIEGGQARSIVLRPDGRDWPPPSSPKRRSLRN
jgi:hypothetical protein